MIHNDIKTLDQKFDFCVVGAGPAGISLALKLAHGGKKVALLESGGEEPMKNKEVTSIKTDKRSIWDFSRVRALGGTTKVWAGRWKLFDAIDLTQRSWVPNSGWPFSVEELASFYEEAADFLKAPDAAYLRQIAFSTKTQELCKTGALEPTIVWTIAEKDFDVGKQYHKELSENPNISVYLGLTVNHIDSDMTHVTGLQAVSKDGTTHTIQAGAYVFAIGGIENARILMASGLGGPAVGKYFMDHSKGTLAKIKPHSSAFEKEWLRKKTPIGTYRVGLRLSDTIQKESHLVNPYVQLEPIYKKGFLNKVMRKLGMTAPLSHIGVVSYFEQIPSMENHLTLLDERDMFGLQRVMLSFELTPLEIESVQKLHALLKERVEVLGIGTLESVFDAQEDMPDLSNINDASHHMGTTRMGTDPSVSVVDTNAKVHGLDNLYIAGSSVFPTGGHANPTATIVALAFRLWHHLLD